jgi:hypothetical protein
MTVSIIFLAAVLFIIALTCLGCCFTLLILAAYMGWQA